MKNNHAAAPLSEDSLCKTTLSVSQLQSRQYCCLTQKEYKQDISSGWTSSLEGRPVLSPCLSLRSSFQDHDATGFGRAALEMPSAGQHQVCAVSLWIKGGRTHSCKYGACQLFAWASSSRLTAVTPARAPPAP